MPKNEIAFTKQCALSTKDWDVFQAIIRKCIRKQDSRDDRVKKAKLLPAV